MNLGSVLRVDIRAAVVLAPDGREVTCRVRAAGIMDRRKRLRGGVVVGDAVEWEEEGEAGVIESVLPRRNDFRRRATGREAQEQVVAANLDRVAAVVALAEPPLHPAVLDRIALAARVGGMPLAIVFNKIDLVAPETAEPPVRLYRELGYDVFPLSAHTGEGIPDFAAALRGGRTLFVGHSGVGKSTLLNRLAPDLGTRIGEISAATGRGRHTTTAALLVRLPDDTEIVDTPGFRSFAPPGAEPDEIVAAFPEIAAIGASCRFRDCRHAVEPGCAVREASERGEVTEARYRSFCKLLEEAEGYREP